MQRHVGEDDESYYSRAVRAAVILLILFLLLIAMLASCVRGDNAEDAHAYEQMLEWHLAATATQSESVACSFQKSLY